MWALKSDECGLESSRPLTILELHFSQIRVSVQMFKLQVLVSMAMTLPSIFFLDSTVFSIGHPKRLLLLAVDP